jgi:NAD(P)-dependent dehydrogenase (short-subunit alcohol dehydrogenase family)
MTRPSPPHSETPGGARRLAGQTAVITGATDGIGRAAAAQFVALGAHTVLVGRNAAKTEGVARALQAVGTAPVSWEVADLSRRDAVAALAERLRGRHPVIHVLANNAGALFLDRETTADGVERTLALNHLAYVQLTLALLDPLLAAARPGAPARVLCVSSRAHENARVAVDDLSLARGFGGWRAYANSKLCNIWFAQGLAQRLDPSLVVAHSLHPGVVRTRFAENNGRMGRLLRRIMDLVSVTPEAGADTLTWLATAPEALEGSGSYWVRRRRTTPSRAARDTALAGRCWAATDALLQLDGDAQVRNALARHRAR